MFNWKKLIKKFKNKPKAVIGRLEYINIPKFGLYGIVAKIDTGAYRGTIHADNIREVEKGDKTYLEFSILDDENPESEKKIHKVSKYKIAKVRGSQSDFAERYVIPVKIEMAGRVIKTQMSLSNRKELRNPVLIGRKALRNKFLVDVTKQI
jgi:hypothetical protein